METAPVNRKQRRSVNDDVKTSSRGEAGCRGSSSSSGTRTNTGASRLPPTDADWLLLETLDTRDRRPLHTGRFLTMHKRRKRRLTTRSLHTELAVLDDLYNGQAQTILDKVGEWPFNAFQLDIVAGGRALPVLCVHLFHWYGLIEHFNLDTVRVWKFFSLVEEGYHSTNPYHNAIHASDVTQAMHCFLQEDKIRKNLTPLETMASLIAAVTHDLDHPGVNQPFLIATSNHLAALYQNTSVLENHHWRSAVGCLLESGVADQLQNDDLQELVFQIQSLILATDITRQAEFLSLFRKYMDKDELDVSLPHCRHFLLQIALKCADICNPCRPWEISKKWSYKVCDEFFRQGDVERKLNMPVTSLCDRTGTSVAKIQAGFFQYVVTPLFKEWHRFMSTPLSTEMMSNLDKNRTHWEEQVQQELAEETKTEISETEIPDVSEASEEDDEVDAESETIGLLPLREAALVGPWDENGERIGRRHSVPLSEPRMLSRTIIRRESLPENRRQKRYPSEMILHLDRDFQSSFSLYSVSSLPQSTNKLDENRPVSADTLLPEPSITSITTSINASRLSVVMLERDGTTSQQHHSRLTRQQTFPPLQPGLPFTRLRYMSSAGEMSSCSEALAEGGSSGSSQTDILSGGTLSRQHSEQEESTRDQNRTDEPCVSDNSEPKCKNGCGTPPRPTLSSSSSSRQDSEEHTVLIPSDQSVSDFVQKTCKSVEVSFKSDNERTKGGKACDPRRGAGEKENVDPTSWKNRVWKSLTEEHLTSEEASTVQKSSILRKPTSQGLVPRLQCRRGSAPVTLLNADESFGRNGSVKTHRLNRRGSVPIDMSKQTGVLKPAGTRENARPVQGMNRRGSLPFDLVSTSSSSGPGQEPFLTILPGSESEGCADQNESSVPTYLISLERLQARRGSVPTELTRLLGSSDSHSKPSKRSRKKVLRRRSSGGPELFSSLLLRRSDSRRIDVEDAPLNKLGLLNRRRGSLPVEVLSGNSGDNSEAS